jgi:chemotaxis protein histidine kinase CheA
VPAERLDALVDLVGELVIAGAAGSTLAERSRNAALIEATSAVARLVEEIRDTALQLRMVPIGETFGRFPRVVRDLARELGKEIELQLSGADTELDKSMVERVADPLMHLVRNAVDHGIEPAALRTARGKPPAGTVRLNAYHDSGSIVVEVSDDGGGLDRARIRRKAVEQGLLGAEQAVSDGELLQLILEPGSSTAEQVTSLSGRGVGMDVVKRNIEVLRGSVGIESQEGVGSTFRLRMPLTLAIIDGFLVQVGAAYHVLPLDLVVECVELTAAGRAESAGRNLINLRGQVLPFSRLREVFEADSPAPARENIVVVRYGSRRAGLVVDRLLGEIQAVIKPLSRFFSGIRGIGGSTILGSGELALILDVPALLQLAAEAEIHHRGACPQPGPRPVSAPLSQSLENRYRSRYTCACESPSRFEAIADSTLYWNIGIGAAALATLLLLSTLILRSLFRELGGEPAHAAGLVRRVAEGDLTISIRTRSGDTGSLLYCLAQMVQRLAGIIGEVRGSADSLSSASEEVSATAQSLSQAVSKQAASVGGDLGPTWTR